MQKRWKTGLLALCLMLCLLTIPAGASQQLAGLSPLSNQDLVKVARNGGFEGWVLYQPSARETETDTSSSRFLEERSIYPVIASRDGQICLIVLKKTDSQWVVSATNNQALRREGFALTGFSLDESSSEPDNIQHVYVDFADKAGDSLSLSIQLSDIYPSYFSHLQYHNFSFFFHYDRGITLQYNYPFLLKCSYEITPQQPISFGVDAFSFAECPLTVQELFVSAVVSPKAEKAGLFLFPDDKAEPITQAAAHESIDVVGQPSGSDWVLVCYNNHLLFIHKADISL